MPPPTTTAPTVSTPDAAARSRSHRGAAGRLIGGTHCWCGTACRAAARAKLTYNLGCAPGRTTYRGEPARPPLAEAGLLALADVLVSTDELDAEYDALGTWERWPNGVGWGRRSDLNTGVVYFRATNGSRAFVQASHPRAAAGTPTGGGCPGLVHPGRLGRLHVL